MYATHATANRTDYHTYYIFRNCMNFRIKWQISNHNFIYSVFLSHSSFLGGFGRKFDIFVGFK